MDAKALALAGTPVIFVDTCSILDIMRDPTRDTVKVNERQAALDLVCIAEKGELWCGMAEQVALEFAQHDQSIQDEAKQKLANLRTCVERIDTLSGILGVAGTIDFSHLDDLVQRARGLVQRWLDQLNQIVPAPNILPKAFARMNACIAPATRGKDSSKDCLIYETCLEAATKLRVAGAVQPIVFLSSNIKEYSANSGLLNSEIEREFTPLNLQFAPNMAAAKHQLGL